MDPGTDRRYWCWLFGSNCHHPTVIPIDSPPTSAPSTSDAPVHRESLAAFLEFAAEAMGLTSAMDGGVLELSFNHREHPEWPKPYQIKVAVAASEVADLPRRVVAPSDGAKWLWKLVDVVRGALMARPVSQPEAVHEFSSRLFDAYQVDEGQTQLSGCRLHEVPFLRITYLAQDNPAEVEHRYVDANGQVVSAATLAELRLADVVPLDLPVAPMTRSQVDSLLQEVDVDVERFVAATIVFAKRAEGAVQFGIGEQCARATFDDWTTTLTAPPYHCAATGIDTFHLAAVDDGRIVAAEAIDICEHSGARVLGCERVACAVTGKQVDPRLAGVCPISGTKLLKSELVACRACRQHVSPTVLSAGVCQACRRLPVARLSDAWVAEIAERFPAIKKYRKFQSGEAGGMIRVMATSVWRRLLFVVPTSGAEPVVVAMRQGLVGGWQRLEKAEWPSVLGKPAD